MKSIRPLSAALLAAAALLVLAVPASAQRLNPTFALTGLGLPIPPSGTGGGAPSPSNTFSVDLDVAVVGTVAAPIVFLNLNHTYAGDLVISLSHGGTTVLLHNRSNNLSDFAGQYDFRDDAAAPLSSVGTPATLPNGTYQPAQPLSAFAGMNAGGRWTLTISDLAGADVGVLDTFGLVVEVNTVTAGLPGLPASIPPSGTGGGGACGQASNTFSRDFVMPAGGRVGAIGLDMNIFHTYAADLAITLSHNGVSRTVTSGQGGGSDLVGDYRFREGFGLFTGSGINVPVGTYGFQDSLNPFLGMEIGGVWTLTVCDRLSGDVGVLNSATLLIAPQSYNFSVLQPNGNADISTSVTGGSRGFNGYFSPFTPVRGTFPFGWFYGLDLSVFELAILVTSNFPTIIGSLDVNGNNLTTLPGPIASNLRLFLTSLELEGPIVRQQATPIVAITQ